ncbi:MAG: conjugal transfer protein TraF [Gemmatimonadota bacterium]
MSTHHESGHRLAGAALLTVMLAAATPVAAQLGNASPAALGMGDNYTALARGLNAPFWNPAGLGMPDNPSFSIAILPLRAGASLSPIGTSDLARYQDKFIPVSVREDWLNQITAAGGEKGEFDTDVTLLAMSVSHLAFQLSTTMHGRVNMAPAFADLFFFGNAGRTGVPQNYTLQGSTVDAAATTTAGVSLGLPLTLTLGPLPDQHFAVGATLKYTIGNVFVTAMDAGSQITSDPLAVDLTFPVLETDTTIDGFPNNGTGVGLDVGAAWSAGIFKAGAVIHNLVNTFKWNIQKLYYRQGTVVANTDTTITNFDAIDYQQAPDSLKNRVNDLFTFKPVLTVAGAAQVLPYLEVTADIQHQLGNSLQLGPRNHVGVGAELTILPVLPVRAGVTLLSGGQMYSGGLGLNLGPVGLNLAAAYRDTNLGSGTIAAFALQVGL